MYKLLPTSLALVLATPFGACADPASDLRALRRDVAAMRAAYEARLQSLERRLQAAEAGPAGAASPGAGGASPHSMPGEPVVASPGAGTGSAAPAASTTTSAAGAGAPPPRAQGIEADRAVRAAQTTRPAPAMPSSAGAAPPFPAAAAATTLPATAGGGNAFNPSISLILSGLYSRTSRDPADYADRRLPAAAGC